MLIWFIIVNILTFKFVSNFNFNTPFYLYSNETYFQVKNSQSSKFKIILFNKSENSNFQVKVGSVEIQKFQISSLHDNYKVLLYLQSIDPIISTVPTEISLKVACRFFYPLLTSGRHGQYRCELKAKGKHSGLIPLGKCQLNLLKTSCFCIIKATVSEKGIHKNELILKATVTKCANHNCNNDSKWDQISSVQMPIKLKDNNKLIWIQQCFDSALKMKLLIGTPRVSPSLEAIFELPLRISLSDPANKFLKFKIELNHSSSLIYENYVKDDTLVGQVVLTFDKSEIEDKNRILITLEMETGEDHQDTSSFSEKDLIILQWKFHPDANSQTSLTLSARIEEVMLDDSERIMKKVDCPNHSNAFTISVVSKDELSIIPVFEKPLILHNLQRSNEPFMLLNGSIKMIYVLNSNIVSLDHNVQCRPFNKSILACPPDLHPISETQSALIENKGMFDYSLELRAQNIQIILDIEPEIIMENVWEISMQDHVLNRIKGWKGPKKRSGTPLLTDTVCENIYQIIPVKIYKKALFYNQATQKTMSIMIDVSNQIEMKNIDIQPPIANIYKYGNNLIIQGVKEGEFTLSLKDDNKKPIIKTHLKVVDRDIYIKDLDVFCISISNVTFSLSNNSFLTDIYDLKFKFKSFNKSEECLLVVDLIYSDNSRTNVVTFDKDQFSMKFVTNKEIIEVFSVTDMIYKYLRFNKETSFFVEISESKNCFSPRQIVKKQVNLDLGFATNHSRAANDSNSIKSESPKTSENLHDQFNQKSYTFHVILYVVCSILAIVLLVVVVKFIRDCHVKRKLNIRIINRRNSCTINNANLNHSDPFNNDYPPLLPSPGPQVGCVDTMAVALASPQSFWCLSQNNTLNNKKTQPFNRQFSLPVKGCEAKNMQTYAQPCPPLRWMHQLMPEESKTNVYTSQEALDGSPAALPGVGSPMCWSVTKTEGDHSSGIGSLMTNMDDLIKDPYDARDRFNRLSELPSMPKDKKENVYEAI